MDNYNSYLSNAIDEHYSNEGCLPFSLDVFSRVHKMNIIRRYLHDNPEAFNKFSRKIYLDEIFCDLIASSSKLKDESEIDKAKHKKLKADFVDEIMEEMEYFLSENYIDKDISEMSSDKANNVYRELKFMAPQKPFKTATVYMLKNGDRI